LKWPPKKRVFAAFRISNYSIPASPFFIRKSNPELIFEVETTASLN
jgi:hypothetical protein